MFDCTICLDRRITFLVEAISSRVCLICRSCCYTSWSSACKSSLPLLSVVWLEETPITPVLSNVIALSVSSVPRGTPPVVSVIVAVKEVASPQGTVPLDAATAIVAVCAIVLYILGELIVAL